MTAQQRFSIIASAMALALSTSVAHAVPYTITANESVSNFGSFTPGTTVNQYDITQRGVHWSVVDEWNTSPGTYDQSIVSIAGNNAWRMSNAVTDGGYSSQPWSPSVAAAGEPGSNLWNDRGTDHTAPIGPLANGGATTDRFFFEFDFGSATGSTQSGLFLSLSPGPRQSAFRQSYLGLSGDSGGGLGISFYDTNAAGGFPQTQVATGLDAALVHHIAMEILFMDGLNGDGTGNDVVNVFVNGALAHTGTTWETYYRLTAGLPDEIAVDSVMFRASGTAALGTSGNGFVFDNVRLFSGPAASVPEPASLALVGLGLAALGFSRLRRRA